MIPPDLPDLPQLEVVFACSRSDTDPANVSRETPPLEDPVAVVMRRHGSWFPGFIEKMSEQGFPLVIVGRISPDSRLFTLRAIGIDGRQLDTHSELSLLYTAAAELYRETAQKIPEPQKRKEAESGQHSSSSAPIEDE